VNTIRELSTLITREMEKQIDKALQEAWLRGYDEALNHLANGDSQ